MSDDEDRVRLQLGDTDILIAEHYQVHIGVLAQPGTFALRLGHDGIVRELLSRFQPGQPFTLTIRGQKQMTGLIEDVIVPGGDGTIIEIQGRDKLAQLHDSYVEEEKTYTDATYFDLVMRELTECGIADWILFEDNDANRTVITGKKSTVKAKVGGRTRIVTDESSARHVRSKLGERRYEFIKRHLDHAGLFLWCTADGSFVLGSPAKEQEPLYRIYRKRGAPQSEVSSVRLGSFRNSSKPPRYTECVIYARTGGRKYHRGIIQGAFVDDEMFNEPPIGFGITNRRLVVRDANVQNIEQAEFMARRKLAEGRRACWQLSYVAGGGHSTPAINGGDPIVWAPDTTVHVVDEELGIDEVLYVESVVHSRTPQTTTQINLMRKRDLIFGMDP